MKKLQKPMSKLLIAALLIVNASFSQSIYNTSVGNNHNIITDDTSSIIIKGKIIDDKGDPIGFASIRSGKKGNVIFANEKGEFVMSVCRSATLIVGSAGYDEKEVVVGTADELKIQLEQAADTGTIDNSSSQVIGRGEFKDEKEVKRMDSLYANDQVIQRDLQLPGSINRISIYPSAVISGGNITLGVQLLEPGKYDWQMVDGSGKIVCQKEVSIEKNAKVINIAIPELATGSYQFVLIQKLNGKKITEKISIL